jgi:hypothetical protein
MVFKFLTRKGSAAGLMAAVLLLGLTGSVLAQDGLGESVSFVDIHGYADLSYFDFQSGGDPDLPYTDGGGVPTFDNNHVTLFFGANITQNLKFVSEFHYEHSFQEPELPQAVIQWQLAEPLVITMGRFWMPFGTLGKDKIYLPTNAMVSFPYTVGQAIPFHLAENGLKIEGWLKDRFGYQVALVNGFDGLDEDAGKRIAGLAKDNNQNKRVYAHVDVRPVSGLEIGGSYTDGKWDNQNKADIYFWGFDLEYALGPVEVRGEYVKGHLQNPSDAMVTVDGTLRCNSAVVNPGCQEPDALRDNMGPLSEGNHSRQAYFVLVSYRVLQNQLGVRSANAIVRVDGFNRDETGDAGDRSRVTVGFNVSPEAHLHLKGEYQWVSEPGKQDSVKNNGVMFQAVADF